MGRAPPGTATPFDGQHVCTPLPRCHDGRCPGDTQSHNDHVDRLLETNLAGFERWNRVHSPLCSSSTVSPSQANGTRVTVWSRDNAKRRQDAQPRSLFRDLEGCGYPPSGIIRIARPSRSPLLTAWIDI